jgi:hypothetical protein
VIGHTAGMIRAGLLLAAAIALPSAAPATADDLVRDPGPLAGFERPERPLNIEIESGLQFGRMALRGTGGGAAQIDPQTGRTRVDGNMIDLGGATFQGRARVTGEPLRPVRIELPATVLLRSSDGAEARLSDFVTDLPPVAVLDENGMLEFSFGARLTSQGARGGAFRGRISIRVDYF